MISPWSLRRELELERLEQTQIEIMHKLFSNEFPTLFISCTCKTSVYVPEHYGFCNTKATIATTLYRNTPIIAQLLTGDLIYNHTTCIIQTPKFLKLLIRDLIDTLYIQTPIIILSQQLISDQSYHHCIYKCPNYFLIIK